MIQSHFLEKILKEISFSVPYGSGFDLLGPNGAGKTTSIRIIGGLIKSDSGKTFVNGNLVSPETAYLIRQNIGFQLDSEAYS